MSTNPVESLSGLRSAWQEARANFSDETTEAAPAEGNTPAAEPVVPAIETPAEQGTPEGATPVEPPAQETTDPYQPLLARYGDPTKVVEAFFGTEQRAKQYALEVKALRKMLGTNEPSEAQPAQPTPPPPPEELPEPLPGGQPPPQVEQWVMGLMAKDEPCVQYQTEYFSHKERLGQIDTEIQDIDSQASALNNLLQPPEFAQKLGYTGPDEFQKQDWKSALTDLRSRKQELLIERMERSNRSGALAQAYEARKQEFHQRVVEGYQERYREAERESEQAQMTQDFKTEWDSAMSLIFTKLNVPQDLQSDISDRAREAALASTVSIPKGKTQEFIERIVKREMDYQDKSHRLKAKREAEMKIADVTPSAPSGPRAVATASPTDSPEDRLKALRADSMRIFGRR